VGCHNPAYLYKLDMVNGLRDGGTFLLNTVWNEEQIEKHLPVNLKRYLASHHNKFYYINAMDIAREVGLGRRINTVMSAAFFEVTDLMDRDSYLPLLRDEIDKAYGKKSQKIVDNNWAAIDKTFEHLHEMKVPAEWADLEAVPLRDAAFEAQRPGYVRNVLDTVNAKEGDNLSVGDLVENGMYDGRMPMGTAAYEKRGIALEVPEWITESCTLCNECSFVCPHAAIRPFLADDEEMQEAPEGYITRDFKGKDGYNYRIQVSVEDCTVCELCATQCPADALQMKPYEEQREQAINWAFAMTLSQKENPIKKTSVRGSQFEKPLFEFSGACAGCGETGYIKLLTQLYGDRMMMANTTG